MIAVIRGVLLAYIAVSAENVPQLAQSSEAGDQRRSGTEGAVVVTVQRPVQLFNGRDLEGFYTWLADGKYSDPRRVFSVTNGMIRISGDGLGYLSTRETYRDYRLRAEFRWGEINTEWGDRIGKARDSGLFLHSVGPDGNSEDGNGAFRAAIECNIFEGATGDFLLIRGRDADGKLIAPKLTAEVAATLDRDGFPYWKRGGQARTIRTWGRLNWFAKDRQWRDEFEFRGAHDIEKPAGDWNRLECICAGDRITIRLNGVTVNEAFDVFPQGGRILLQCEGSEIFFRNIELLPLEPQENDPNRPENDQSL